MPKILIVDDELNIRELVKNMLFLKILNQILQQME